MSCNCKGKCGIAKIAWVLVLVGGINWGLVGVGMLMGSDLNAVGLILGSGTLAAVVYLLVGISTLVSIFGCPCKKCKDGCKDCQVSAPTSTSSM
jgi:uncharacterized membrane protein YuzA (DUF378 family)